MNCSMDDPRLNGSVARHERNLYRPRRDADRPKPGITRSIQYALGKLDRPIPLADELTWCIGPPLRGSLKQLLGTDELADRAVTLYRERFSDIGLFENEVYPGIEDTLSTLARSGQRLFVATSKARIYAERIIDH